MRNSQSKSIQESLSEFEKLSLKFDWTNEDFEEVYNKTIKAIAESPYMFNYYHWITNIKDLSIAHIHGLKKTLGYDEEGFSLEKSFSIIHPNFRPFVLEYARNAYEMLSIPKYRPLSQKAHYSIQFPVQRIDGEYILVQMNISIIMVDRDGNPLMNYNRFEVLGKYFDGPIFIKPNVHFRAGIDLSDKAREAEAELTLKVRTFLLKHLKFTQKEIDVLKCLMCDEKLPDIALKLKLSAETIKVHNRHILTKARKSLSPLFKDARSVAKYLNNLSII